WVQISGQIALNSKGEAWRLFSRLPDAALPVSSNCDFLTTGCLPGRSARGPSEIFQLHSDGTLWAGKLAGPAKDRRVRPATKWRRIGKRSDWISLDGWSGTVIGVTADGTIWTWGTDISQEGVEMLQSRIETLKRKAMTLLRA